MKKLTKYLLFVLILVLTGIYVVIGEKDKRMESHNNIDFTTLESKPKREKGQKRAGPEIERKYFEQQHYPYGVVLEQNMLNNIWNDVRNLSNESDHPDQVTSWTPLGPFGSVIPSTNTRFTGRILDINAGDTSFIKIAAASGGLWVWGSPNPNALTEQLTSQAASSFDVQPGNSNVMILGTGEPHMRGGTGIYKTTNGGTNWTSINLNDTVPAGFYKIRYSSANVVHAASTRGYYRSDNNGANWSKYLTGDISDVDVHPTDNNIIYCCRRQIADADSGGVYKSINNGINWTRMSNGIPVSNVGRTSISIAKSSPNFAYVLMSMRNGNMMGVYRTAGADAWTNVSPSTDIFDGLGWYTCAIGVSPTSPSKVLIGGIWLWRTTNLGLNWALIDNNVQLNVHADQHSIVWSNDGNSVWTGNDGGLSYSDDGGFSFNTVKNHWPITQYYNVDVSVSNPAIFMGGSQDNGITSTTNSGASWKYNISWGGDGSGASINPFDPNERYMTIGVYGDDWPFHSHRTTNGGDNWTEINSGLDPSSQWFTRIRTDNVNPVTVFMSSGNFLYYSTNKGTNWIKRNPAAFPAWIANFSVRKYGDTSIAYVCTDSRSSGERIFIQTASGAFTERSDDISDGYGINAVTMHPTNMNVAYAVIKGMYNGAKLFKTTNRGVNWVNISSNLPNVPAAAMTTYPGNDNILYLGTEMGCFKTTNGGISWFRWNDGMPEAIIVSEMKSYYSGGDFYVLAGTYGRGMWNRKDDELLAIVSTGEVPFKYELYQNYPNPFNPSTKIKFAIPASGKVELEVYDINGRLVKTVVNGIIVAGTHEINFNGTGLASGVYFYKVSTKNFIAVKKMILLK